MAKLPNGRPLGPLPITPGVLGAPFNQGRLPRNPMRMPNRNPAAIWAVSLNREQLNARHATETRIVTPHEARASGFDVYKIVDFPAQIELVPEHAQRINLRLFLTPGTWATIRARKVIAAGGLCELCHRPAERFDCHETWLYDDERRTQRLMGLSCLCRPCHSIKHLGYSYFEQLRARAELAARAEARQPATEARRDATAEPLDRDPDDTVGRSKMRSLQQSAFAFDRAIAHMQKINGLTQTQAGAYYLWALGEQRKRKDTVWAINLDWLFDWAAAPDEHGAPIALRWNNTSADACKHAEKLIGRAAVAFGAPTSA